MTFFFNELSWEIVIYSLMMMVASCRKMRRRFVWNGIQLIHMIIFHRVSSYIMHMWQLGWSQSYHGFVFPVMNIGAHEKRQQEREFNMYHLTTFSNSDWLTYTSKRANKYQYTSMEEVIDDVNFAPRVTGQNIDKLRCQIPADIFCLSIVKCFLKLFYSSRIAWCFSTNCRIMKAV